MNIWNKLGTLAQSFMHGVVDAGLDMNNIQVVKVHIRKLEEARDEIGDGVAVAKGRKIDLEKQIAALKAQIESAQVDIDLILGDDDPSNDAHAVILETRTIEREREVDQKEEELIEANVTLNGLENAFKKISSQHKTMLNQVHNLDQMVRSTRAKESATAALKAAATLGNNVSVDNITARMRDQAVKANAKFDRALEGVGDGADDAVLAATAAARIAARKAELKEQAESKAEAA